MISIHYQANRLLEYSKLSGRIWYFDLIQNSHLLIYKCVMKCVVARGENEQSDLGN